jgi:hypothetical protein
MTTPQLLLSLALLGIAMLIDTIILWAACALAGQVDREMYR